MRKKNYADTSSYLELCRITRKRMGLAKAGRNSGVVLFSNSLNSGILLYMTNGHIRYTLRKHAYANIEKISPPKTENFQVKKNSDIFHISAQNIDRGYSLEPPRRGGSNEYPQSMFLAEIRKIIYTHVSPSFTI